MKNKLIYPTEGYKTERGDIKIENCQNMTIYVHQIIKMDGTLLDTFWKRLLWLFRGSKYE